MSPRSQRVKTWMNNRRLMLNAGKIDCLLISSNTRYIILDDITSVPINGECIEMKNVVRNLGVLIDSSLSLVNQINNVKKNTIGSLVNISRISSFLDRKTRMKLVHSLIFSIIYLCNPVYYGLPNQNAGRKPQRQKPHGKKPHR